MTTVNARSISFEKSSNLQAATLHPDGRLEVTFRADAKRPASTYSYANFTDAKFDEWQTAKSAGSWFDKNVKKRADEHPLVPTPPPKPGELRDPSEVFKPGTLAPADATGGFTPTHVSANADGSFTLGGVHHRPDPERVVTMDPAQPGGERSTEAIVEVKEDGSIRVAEVLTPRPRSGNPPVVLSFQPEGVVVDARRFYERYCDDADWKNFQGNLCPSWPELPSKIRGHWCAVALEARLMMQRPADAGDAQSLLDGVYDERNRLAAALARAARKLGWKVGIGEHNQNDAGWDPEWRTILYIDTPTGQVSWHLHDRDRPLLVGLPRYDAPWDGHSTPEKYERLGRL